MVARTSHPSASPQTTVSYVGRDAINIFATRVTTPANNK